MLPFAAKTELEVGGKSYTLTAEMNMTDDGIKPVKVEVKGDDHRPVTSSVIRAVKLTEVTRDAIAGMVVHDDGNTFNIYDTETKAEKIREAGPTDESLEYVGFVYTYANYLGLPPAREVEQVTGLTRPTSTRWIRKARDKGYITEVSDGLD